jgi:hypothetical protein
MLFCPERIPRSEWILVARDWLYTKGGDHLTVRIVEEVSGRRSRLDYVEYPLIACHSSH